MAVYLPFRSDPAGLDGFELSAARLRCESTQRISHWCAILRGPPSVPFGGGWQYISRSDLILLDLMDLSFPQRAYAVNQLKESLTGAQFSAGLHLYLLVADGSIYPVPGLGGDQLDQAIAKVNRVRPMDVKADPVERFKTTYSALDSMSQELARFPGSKQLLWITDGIPSTMRMVHGWMDLTPRSRQLAAQFNRGDIVVYTLDPSLILGNLERAGRA